MSGQVVHQDLEALLDGPQWEALSGIASDHPADLADEIYWRLVRRGPMAGRKHDPMALRRHVALLSEANSGTGTWEPEWSADTVRRLPARGAVKLAEKDGVLYRMAPDQIRSADGRARVRVPKERCWMLPGYYVALGDSDFPAIADLGWVARLYWNLRLEAAPEWVRLMTDALNRRSIPFQLKVPSSPRHYRRADAGVLCLPPDDFRAARRVVADVHKKLAGGLRGTVPCLTRELAPGLAVAEGPADGSSFAESRARLIAEAVTRANDGGCGSPEARCEKVRAAFEAAGLDVLRPHLGPASDTLYKAIPGRRRSWASPGTLAEASFDPLAGASAAGPVAFRDAAVEIAKDLESAAFWHGGRCNWVERCETPGTPGSSAAARFTPATASLDAGLHGGTSGMAMFFAQLSRITGEPAHGRLALGALRHAHARLGRPKVAHSPWSVAGGRLGFVWASLRVAALTNDERAIVAVRSLVPNLAVDLSAAPSPAGPVACAEAIAGLIAIYRETRETRLLELAFRLGRGLRTEIEGEEVVPETARIASALIDLFVETGRQGLLEWAARLLVGGVAEGERQSGDSGAARTPRGAWPGSLVRTTARLKALALAGGRPRSLRANARADCDALAVDIARSLRHRGDSDGDGDGDGDGGLCDGDEDWARTSVRDGICGRVDLLLVASGILREEAYREAAEEAMAVLLARHHRRARRTAPPAPSLFLGVAGLAYTFLRCSDPQAVPSLLLPGLVAARRGEAR